MIQSGLRCNDDVTTHPAAISLAKFCLNQLEQGMHIFQCLIIRYCLKAMLQRHIKVCSSHAQTCTQLES